MAVAFEQPTRTPRSTFTLNAGSSRLRDKAEDETNASRLIAGVMYMVCSGPSPSSRCKVLRHRSSIIKATPPGCESRHPPPVRLKVELCSSPMTSLGIPLGFDMSAASYTMRSEQLHTWILSEECRVSDVYIRAGVAFACKWIEGGALTVSLQTEPLRDGSVLSPLLRQLLLDSEGLLGWLKGRNGSQHHCLGPIKSL